MPGGVWALGLVSLFMDVSSEMIHSLLPVFLVTVLGASTASVGLIEGLSEATASATKFFSGWASDRMKARKGLLVLGYGIAALCKPLFAVAPGAAWVLGARVADRIGKGVREAPRDALIADLTPAQARGAAYGLRQSLDTVGAVAGPLLALALMAAFANDFRRVFWLALIPALLALVVLVTRVREPPRADGRAGASPFDRAMLGALGRPFWVMTVLGSTLMVARFSEAFLILRAHDLHWPLALTPLVLVTMNVVYAASAYPLGRWSDRIDRWRLLMAGFGVLLIADLVLAVASGPLGVAIGTALWGLHLGLTQGLIAALVADAAPAPLRGTAFGVFNLAGGLTLLASSLGAGLIWELFGPRATFLTGAAITLAGLAATTSRRPAPPPGT